MQHCTQYYDESSAAAPTFAVALRLVEAASKARVRNQRGISEECGSGGRRMGNIWLIWAERPPLALEGSYKHLNPFPVLS